MANKIRDFFDEVAADRNLKLARNPIVEYEQRVRYRTVISMLDAKPNEVILDVGCGNACAQPVCFFRSNNIFQHLSATGAQNIRELNLS